MFVYAYAQVWITHNLRTSIQEETRSIHFGIVVINILLVSVHFETQNQ